MKMNEKEKLNQEKIDAAESHFEAENMNKYDDLDLKEKNLKINEFETEYVDPTDEEVKDIRNHPGVDLHEVEKRNPDTLLNGKEEPPVEYEAGKIDEAESHFEAVNMNKYDDLELKERNLKINEFETEYVDPTDEEVKDIKNHPCVDQEEVEKRNPDEFSKKI